jgi:transposase-like protein
MTQRNRKRFDPAFKARVALAAMQERESLAQLGKKFGVHPGKKQLLEKAASAFSRDSSQETERIQDELLKKIGELTVERDF